MSKIPLRNWFSRNSIHLPARTVGEEERREKQGGWEQDDAAIVMAASCPSCRTADVGVGKKTRVTRIGPRGKRGGEKSSGEAGAGASQAFTTCSLQMRRAGPAGFEDHAPKGKWS